MARAPQVVRNIAALRDLDAATPGTADPGHDAGLSLQAAAPDDNPALAVWTARAAAQPATS